jgi:hypothetical protein
MDVSSANVLVLRQISEPGRVEDAPQELRRILV